MLDQAIIEMALQTIGWMGYFLAAVLSAGHALFYKRDPRAVLFWMLVCFALPYVGALFYALFGINRITTRTRRLLAERSGLPELDVLNPSTLITNPTVELPPGLASFAPVSAGLTGRPLATADQVTPYFSGETAYQAMLQSIEQAQFSVLLSAFIFSMDSSGKRFLAALQAADRRGVTVRVLVDGVGAFYSLPHASLKLTQAGIRCETFIPVRLWPPSFHINLRNHRKLLVVDGCQAFTGGMNIRDRHLSNTEGMSRYAIQDMHFLFEGAISAQLQRVFEEDWCFVTGESPIGNVKQGIVPVPAGGDSHICRVITDGPNEDLDKLTTILIGVIALARRKVAIMVPYFLPPISLIEALKAAVLRNVEVVIILPERSNQPVVHWATQHMLWQLLEFGVRILYQPPPFAHSKFIVIDECYAQVGSANLDARSLRLNFELMVEVYGGSLVEELSRHFDTMCQRSREETLERVDARGFWIRLRDAVARLFSPFL